MGKFYFVTDLDRTIIHAKNKGYKCVEKSGEKEITYMTEKSYRDLKELLKNKKIKLVPCTMRSIKQTLRVNFIKEYKPEIIICCNGGQVYINGEMDKEWKRVIDDIVDSEKILKDISYLEELKNEVKENINILEVRNIQELYIEVKAFNEEEAIKFFNIIKDGFSEKFRILQIKAKIFIIDKRINKVKSLCRVGVRPFPLPSLSFYFTFIF